MRLCTSYTCEGQLEICTLETRGFICDLVIVVRWNLSSTSPLSGSFEHAVFVRVSALTWSFLLLSHALSFPSHVIFLTFPKFCCLSAPLYLLASTPHHPQPPRPSLRRLRRYEENHHQEVEHARFATSHPGLGQIWNRFNYIVQLFCAVTEMHQVIEQVSVDCWPGSGPFLRSQSH